MRKETAKEILEKIRTEFKKLEELGLGMALVHFAAIEEIVREYGVEIK